MSLTSYCSVASGIAGSSNDLWNTRKMRMRLGSSSSKLTGPLHFRILNGPSLTISNFFVGLSDLILRRRR
jgi:hypothetical protein